MMTRKHFIRLAEILKENESKKDIINEIARFCKQENSNFNVYRFKSACGLADNEI